MTAQPQSLSVLGSEILVRKINQEDFLCLSDIAKHKDPDRADYIIQNRMRKKNTIEYLGLREIIHNPHFKSIEFDGFKTEAGSNSFSMPPKRRIETTNCVGITSKKGKYGGGTYAHKDIAIKFAGWISVEFELYLIKDYQRLKEEESSSLDRNIKRVISKVNYKIHTDAIRDSLIPARLSAQQKAYIYADEADILNISLFGETAKEWRESHKELNGNMRDHATIEQLIVLANLESINAELIRQALSQSQRLEILNNSAIVQMNSLLVRERSRARESILQK